MYDDDKIADYKRTLFYKMLRNHCLKESATLEELRVAIPYVEPKLEAYLQGLIYLGELEIVDSLDVINAIDTSDTLDVRGFDNTGFDDTGFDTPQPVAATRRVVKHSKPNQPKKGYRLTEFGKRWAEMMVLGLKEDEDGSSL